MAYSKLFGNCIKKILSMRDVTKIAYVDNKFSTSFCVKDVTEFKHNHDIIYQGKYPEICCNDHYLGEFLTLGYRKEYYTMLEEIKIHIFFNIL